MRSERIEKALSILKRGSAANNDIVKSAVKKFESGSIDRLALGNIAEDQNFHEAAELLLMLEPTPRLQRQFNSIDRGKDRYGSKVNNDSGAGFYVVDRNDEVGDGPFPTKEKAEESRDKYFKGQQVKYGKATDKGHFISI